MISRMSSVVKASSDGISLGNLIAFISSSYSAAFNSRLRSSFVSLITFLLQPELRGKISTHMEVVGMEIGPVEGLFMEVDKIFDKVSAFFIVSGFHDRKLDPVKDTQNELAVLLGLSSARCSVCESVLLSESGAGDLKSCRSLEYKGRGLEDSAGVLLTQVVLADHVTKRDILY
ncbi:hypothetical protein BDZ97DRAFT_1809500 [Flammula alnicola]|nr:hypothetical protein BDZ97DRAFT_1809500 [Flammula alnicola]